MLVHKLRGAISSINEAIQKLYFNNNINEFLDAINDKNIGTIDVDCDEINFEKKNLSKKKIFVNHPVRILGNGKIAHARFVLMPKSFLIVGGSVCIDNTRKPYSMHIAKSIFEMHDDTVFSLIDDATINNGYGIGYGGYAIDAKGKNTSVYLASSGHNFTGSGIVVQPQHLHVRKNFIYFRHRRLGAYTSEGQMRIAAFGTFVYHIVLLAAIMAFQSLVLFVIRKTYFAVGAFRNVSASLTPYKRGKSAAVYKYHRLFLFFHRFRQLGQ